MKKFYFEKATKEDGNISILATADGWTNEYTTDGEVDTSLEYTVNNEITQEEAEEILNEYGWVICEECGDIFVDGGDCKKCISIRSAMIEKLINEIEHFEISETDIRKSQHLDCFTDWLDIKWIEFEEDESNLTDDRWRHEGYIIEFIFREHGIETLAGVTIQELANQPTWGVDEWEDLDIDQLQELLELGHKYK